MFEQRIAACPADRCPDVVNGAAADRQTAQIHHRLRLGAVVGHADCLDSAIVSRGQLAAKIELAREVDVMKRPVLPKFK